MTVEDDGQGFDVDARSRQAPESGSVGILGMHERVEAVGGTVEIRSRLGEGTRLRVRIPLDERDAPD